ncbi:MAG TPA: TolC family protein, partial [Candidatus Polarisedimenticolia bacterium]|nr:TolC family protein [Candidatus Polarisedimenticolia bacterium]
MNVRGLVSILLAGILATASLAAATQEPSDPLARVRERGMLTLSDSFAAAAASNERVARAQEDLNQARLFRTSARSQVLPQLTLVDVYYRQNPVSVNSGGTGNVVTVSDTRNELRVDLTQPIFHGLRDRNFLLYSAKNIEASRYAVEETRRLLYSDVALAFYTVLEHEGQVEALERILKMER